MHVSKVVAGDVLTQRVEGQVALADGVGGHALQVAQGRAELIEHEAGQAVGGDPLELLLPGVNDERVDVGEPLVALPLLDRLVGDTAADAVDVVEVARARHDELHARVKLRVANPALNGAEVDLRVSLRCVSSERHTQLE